MTVSRLLFIGMATLLAAALARGAETSVLAHLSFQASMQAGSRDTNGNAVAGTEVMHLVPHKGRLYAGNSLWMEKDPDVPKACQVLVLDSPTNAWRVDHQFTRRCLRLGSLKSVTFSGGGQSKVAGAVTLLLAAPDVMRGPVNVFCRDDATGQWVPSVLGVATNYTSIRALGIHRDRVTGREQVFAGTDKLGVFAGVLAAAAPGRLRWAAAPEMLTPAGARVMGFCDCNGTFYCATSRHIFQRTDGAAASWKQIYFCPEETSPCGIRGLSAVPNPAGHGEVLLFAALSKMRRLDPFDGCKETVEMDLPQFLTQLWGVKVSFVLSAYNEFLPYKLPRTGETVWLFGFESSYPAAVVQANAGKLRLFVREGHRGAFAAEARYFIRHANGKHISYEVAEVADPRQPALVAVRALAVSPFAEDGGRALYFGGFDCNAVPSHNTAWIYRGVLPGQ
jgi:hypothetical protein